MSKRLPIIHLSVIALGLVALAVGAWFYSSAADPVAGIPGGLNGAPQTVEAPVTPEACAAQGGVWNECASACPPGAEACVLMCVPKCEGIGDGKKVVEVYFGNSKADLKSKDCSATHPVKRAVDVSIGESSATVAALLKGPTGAETDAGYFTTIPDGTTLKSFAIAKGVVTVDFGGDIGKVAGSCRVTAIRSQIEQTLMQFPGVTKVVISVDGKIDEALQP